MILYYTTTQKKTQQANPELSLGGYLSLTQIPNGKSESLFTELTLNDLEISIFSSICIGIDNPTEVVYTDVKAWVESEGEYFIYKLLGVTPGYDSKCDEYYFDSIVSHREIPLVGELDEYPSLPYSLNLGNIEPGGVMGLWIVREITTQGKELLLQRLGELDSYCSSDEQANIENVKTKLNSLKGVEEKFSLKINF